MGGVLALIIQLLSGAVGGNLAGAILKKFSLGTVGNSIIGILGGGLGGQLLGLLGVAMSGGGGTSAGQVIANIAGGGVGGGILLAIIGAIRSAVKK